MNGYTVCAEYVGKDFSRQRSLQRFDHFLHAQDYADGLRLEAEAAWQIDESMSGYQGPLQIGEQPVIVGPGSTPAIWRYDEASERWQES